MSDQSISNTCIIFTYHSSGHSIFFGLETFRNPLLQNKLYFIRKCYETFFKQILDIRASLPIDTKGLGMWFTGTPRIGKSVFLGYVAERLKEEGIEFVVTTGNEWYTKHYERKCYSELEDDLKNRSVVHLIDPGDNPPILGLQRHEAFAIFFASPTISNINPYHQKELCTLFMPLWSRNEMEDCCTTLETPFNEDIFNRWGGVFIDSFRDEMLEDPTRQNSSILHFKRYSFEPPL